jgi:hypothetical protein
MRCLAELHCWRSRLRHDCSQSRSPGQVAAQLALRAQTCSPSPCLQQGANLTLPARLRRQQGAPPGTASALVTPLVACRRCGAVACHQQGGKGLGRHLAGRLVGAEKHSVEVGVRSTLRHHACRGCLSAAGEAREASSPAPPRREHRKAVLPQAGPPTMKPGRMLTQPSPCIASTKRAKTIRQKKAPPRRRGCANPIFLFTL